MNSLDEEVDLPCRSGQGLTLSEKVRDARSLAAFRCCVRSLIREDSEMCRRRLNTQPFAGARAPVIVTTPYLRRGVYGQGWAQADLDLAVQYWGHPASGVGTVEACPLEGVSRKPGGRHCSRP